MNDAFKAWLDAMPIDDVRGRIERLERKLSDLRVIERLYSERHTDAGSQTTPEPAGHETLSQPYGGESTELTGTDDASEPDAGPSEFGSPPM